MEVRPNVKLISHTLNPELVVALAGKLCYSPSDIEALMEKQTTEDIERFVKMLVSMKHESPLEHISFTFGIEGISRACTHQLVRHRIASYSQQSQRYVNLSETFNYIIPEEIRKVPYLRDRFEKSMRSSHEQYVKIYEEMLEYKIYEYLIENRKIYSPDTPMERLKQIMETTYKNKYRELKKVAIENARAVLPNACETKIIVTMNLRSLINFCKHRCCNRAQDEIREVAWEMVKAITSESELLGSLLGASCQFGACPEGNMTCKKPYPKKVV